MDELIKQIVDIIGDYQKDDKDVDTAHVKKWICQFDEGDREFLLSELFHLLPKIYLTKEHSLTIIGNMFETLQNDFKYNNIDDFLAETKFLDLQKEDKSQKVFLEFVNGILNEKYDYTLNDCGKGDIKQWLYVDDVIATGGTFKNDIQEEIKTFGIENFKKSKLNIITVIVVNHTWGISNVKHILNKKLDFNVENKLKFYKIADIENDPRINDYNPKPIFNHIYPLESDLGKEILDFIDKTISNKHQWRNKEHAFRNPQLPKEEKFFSSPDNRKRYENILLAKGFEIMKRIDYI